MNGIWDSFAIYKYCLYQGYALLMVSYFYFYFFTDKKAKYVVISLHEQLKLKKKKKIQKTISHAERKNSPPNS